jgi:NAD(P)-dependent dehydrogenase (short-subunit alcohol dehydrogenase family)
VNGRTVLITGCSSGLGHAMALRFAERGWNVLAAVRGSDERLAEVAATFERQAVRVVKLDVDSPSDRKRVASEIGQLDCLVNNAGFGAFGAFEEMTEEEIRAQMETNFFGSVLLTRELLPQLRASRGRIINISSVFGFTGFPMTSMYCASKFAIEGWSEALAMELRPHGVQLSIVEPGGHRTSFGGNAQWPEPKIEAYATQNRRMRAFRASLSKKRGVTPESLAKRVVAIAEMKRMPLRVRIGNDAAVTWMARRMFPQRISYSLFTRGVERLMRRADE